MPGSATKIQGAGFSKWQDMGVKINSAIKIVKINNVTTFFPV